jgi:hypothetical protein
LLGILSNRLTSYQLWRSSNTQEGRMIQKGGNSVFTRIEEEEDEDGIIHFNVRCREGISLLLNSRIYYIPPILHNNDKKVATFIGTCYAHAVEAILKAFFFRFKTEREAKEFTEMYERLGSPGRGEYINVTGDVAWEETGNDDTGTGDPPIDCRPVVATHGGGGGDFTTVNEEVAEENHNYDARTGGPPTDGPPIAATRGGGSATIDKDVAEEETGNDDDPPTGSLPVAATRSGGGGFTTVDKDVAEEETGNDDDPPTCGLPVAATRGGGGGFTSVNEEVAEENRKYDARTGYPPTDGPPIAATRGGGGFTTIDKDVTEEELKKCNDDAGAGDPAAVTVAAAKGQYANTGRNIWSVPKAPKGRYKY